MIFRPDPMNDIETFKSRFLLSCLQYYFTEHFAPMPIKRHKLETTIQALARKDDLILVPIKSDSDDYITGLFSGEQLDLDRLSD